jgi:hypothetical protein
MQRRDDGGSVILDESLLNGIADDLLNVGIDSEAPAKLDRTCGKNKSSCRMDIIGHVGATPLPRR